MKNVFIVLVFAVLGWFFIVQKQHDEKPAGSPTSAHQPQPPRQVSEHNWMKHSLDTTNKVRQQVAQQRKEDGTR
jgi:hypothetical protein